MVIYVIGFIGSDRLGTARRISVEYGIPCYDLAAEIERRDGRTIRRMVITMGEHELRNKEYETLTSILRELGEPAGPGEPAGGPKKPTAGPTSFCDAADVTADAPAGPEELTDRPEEPAGGSASSCGAEHALAGPAPSCGAEHALAGPAPSCGAAGSPAATKKQTACPVDSATSGAGYTAVVACCDDTVLDPMSAELVRAGKVVFADGESPDAMFARARADKTTHYAFLGDPDAARAKERFRKLYEQRRALYDSFK